jgi:hypothetical protein
VFVLVSKAEMRRLVEADLVRWPPFLFDGRVYAWRRQSEDNPAGLIWCDV